MADGGGRGSWLTREGLDPFVGARFVSSTRGAQRLVASRESDDGEKGEDEAGSRADVPLTEDDAEVASVPCEEHL
jgi:hypothetical protein